MAGFFENGICYAVQQEAIDAHYQSIKPTILHTSTTNYISEYVRQASGSWSLVKKTISSTGITTTNYSIPQPALIQASCQSPNDNSAQFFTGVELGWGVSSVIVIAFLLRRLRRGF